MKLQGSLKVIKLSVAIILFAAFLLFFLRVNLWDYDFWWHIATGRYIVTEGHLPEKDPFSFTSAMEENKNLFPERENFLLRQYWLAQSLFYIIFDYTGPKGIIFLRSILLVLTLFVVFRHLQRSGVSLPVSYISVFLVFTILTRFSGERPVLFSILFTAVILFLLEEFRDKKDKRLYLLAPVMLLWSNMHGGFIIGNIIIMVFMFGEALKIFFKKSGLTKKEMKTFYSAAGIALIASFINPTGWDAFIMALSPKYNTFLKDVQEWQSPFSFYTDKIFSFNYPYFIILLIFPLVLILRNRRLDLTHFFLLSGFFYMGISTLRFVIFYAIIATMIMARELDITIDNLLRKKLSEKSYKKIEYGLAVAVLCSTLLLMTGYFKYEKFQFRTARGITVPESAVSFVKENKIEGNMFNDIGYGGYLTWRLYPWKKNFLDTRALNSTVMTEYEWILRAIKLDTGLKPSASNTHLWEMLLNHYKINVSVLSLLSIYGEVSNLVFKLTESDNWSPVYNDQISIIFVRNTEQNMDIIKRFRLSKEDVYNTIVFKSSSNALSNKVNPRYLISLGETFYRMDRIDDAVKAYRYALKRMPESPFIKARLAQIESELNL